MGKKEHRFPPPTSLGDSKGEGRERLGLEEDNAVLPTTCRASPPIAKHYLGFA